MHGLISMFLLVRFGMLMKYASLITIVFAVSTLLFAQNTKAASTDTTFDGTWSVTVDFHEYKNPDGSMARAWVKHFAAEVKNGVLHGELGTRGAPDWYELNGKYRPTARQCYALRVLLGTRRTRRTPLIRALGYHMNIK
jgi:hypothetical protein